MIVRDEERFLSDCLKSIQSIADEIVVVDTGSKDQTASIAERFNAKVYHFTWQNDFSAARNEALKRCHGKWILYIDADERVSPADKEAIAPFLHNNSVVAYTLRFYPKTGYTPYREYRIFRNDPRIRYKGVIHETMLPSIQAVAKEDSLSIKKIPLTIRHVGYDDNQMAKHKRNVSLLRAAVKNNPKRVYLWWHLGCVLKALGDEQGAEVAWTRGVETVRQQEKLIPEDSLVFGELIRLYYDKGIDTEELLNEALQNFPQQRLLIWFKAMIDTQKQNYSEAIKLFESLTAIDPENFEDDLAYEAGIFGKLSYEPLAYCYYKSGIFKKSAECYQRCEQYEPDNSANKVKRLFVSIREDNRNAY